MKTLKPESFLATYTLAIYGKAMKRTLLLLFCLLFLADVFVFR